MKATLSSVSIEAGVSEATVSRVINGRPGVSAATRKRVREVLDRHGYAKELAGGASRHVGIVVPELINPIFGMFAELVEAQLSLRGFSALIACARTSDDESEFGNTLLQNTAAGMILISGTNSTANRNPATLADLASRGLRMVVVNGPVPEIGAPALTTDFAEGMRESMRHLRAMGHERIGFASGPFTSHSSSLQLAAYRETTTSASLPTLDVSTSYSIEGGELATTLLLDEAVTAIIYASDIMALGGLRALQRRGISVPSDLSVIGMDDSTFMQFTNPALTTVRQPVQELAQESVNALVAAMQGAADTGGELLFRPELVIRESTGHIAANTQQPAS